MFDMGQRRVLTKNQLVEVICQLRYPDILKIETEVPAAFQDAIRAEYPIYEKRTEQLPPRLVGGKPEAQGSVQNHQFISQDGKWKVSMTRNFIALSTHAYSCWEDFAKRLDVLLEIFIRQYAPADFQRVGLRYINALNKDALGLSDTPWRELIAPGFLGLMAEEDVPERAFAKCEQTMTAAIPGGAKVNLKCGPGVLRKVNNRTRETKEERVFMLDMDLYMEGNTPLNHVVPALNVVHGNAGSIFRSAVTPTLLDAMEQAEA